MPALRDELFALETRLLDASVRADRAELDALLADDFLEHGASGRAYDKAATLAALASEAPRAIAVEAFSVRPFAPDLALALYRATSAGHASLRASLWAKRDGRWRMVFHQGTAVP